jgi:hypothetical protein
MSYIKWVLLVACVLFVALPLLSKRSEKTDVEKGELP